MVWRPLQFLNIGCLNEEGRVTFWDIAHLARLMRLARLYIRKIRIDSCSFPLSKSEPTRNKTTP